jgi:hypothetical protein
MSSRPRGARWRRHRFLRRIAPLLFLFALEACRPGGGVDEPGIRRLEELFGGEAFAPVTARGQTRPASRLSFRAGQPLRQTLGDLPEGSLEFGISVADPGIERIRIELVSGVVAPRIVDRCTIEPPPSGLTDGQGWFDCRLRWNGKLHRAALRLVVAGPAEGFLQVSQSIVARAGLQGPGPVFVLLWDTVRADLLSPWGGPQPIGVELAALAGDALVFANLQAVSSWTRPSTASILTGLAPQRHGANTRTDVLGSQVVTLAEVLAAEGVATEAWSVNPNILPIWGFDQGFDRFTDQGAQNLFDHKVDGATVFEALLDRLDELSDRPALYYLHLMDAHDPFLPSAADSEAAEAIVDGYGLTDALRAPVASDVDEEAARAEVERELTGYVGELLDLDRNLGVLVAALRRRGLYERSTILVVSDHGEEFRDHGGMRHGRTLFQEQLHVPALVKLPGGRFAGRRIEATASHVDLLPTLLAALGVNAPSEIDGVDRLGPGAGDENEVFVATLDLDNVVLGAALARRLKLIVDHRGGSALFDLATDPRERNPLAPETALEEREALARRITHDRSKHRPGWHLLLCGGREEGSLELHFEDPPAVPRGLRLEGNDRLTWARGSAPWSLSVNLDPREIRREQFGKIRDVLERDDDEVWIPAGEKVSGSISFVNGAGAAPVALLLGNSEQALMRDRVDLEEIAAAARSEASEVFRCGLRPWAGADRDRSGLWSFGPHVRVWYVEAADGLDEESIDDGLRDRLRRLGYFE